MKLRSWATLLLAVAPAAHAQTLTALASLPVFFTCLAQDKELRDQLLPGLRNKDPDDVDAARWGTMLETSPWAACVTRKQWISKAFCADLIEAHKGTKRDIAHAMEKHWPEYQGLKPAVDYFQASFPGGTKPPAPVPCPE